jgi:hypothetical protein
MMRNAVTENDRKSPFYLAIGGVIYSIASAFWLIITYVVGDVQDIFLMGLASLLLALLAGTSVFTMQRTRQYAGGTSASSALGKWMGLIFSIQGIAIGAGSGILVALEQADLIVPWVAAVVGLHFFPLGRLLNLSTDYLLGSVILLLVVGTTVAAPQNSWAAIIALGTAVFLWLAGVGRLMAARLWRISDERQ